MGLNGETSGSGVINQGFQEDQPTNENKTNDKVIEADHDIDLEDCSLFCLKLRPLNVFRNPKWFLVFISVAAFIQGLSINGFVNVVITSIERRFGLNSTQTGTIASTYDIGSMIIMIPVCFLGGKIGSSKPRWIGLGTLCMGLGSLIWTIPHFSTPPYKPSTDNSSSDTSLSLCSDQNNNPDNNISTKQDDLQIQTNILSSYRFVFILGQLLHGFGAAPLISLGTTFLDQSVLAKNSPMYIAIFQTWFIVGPAVGYIAGGRLLAVHTDLLANSDSGLTPLSPSWVGAWWPGFLISFLASMLTGLVLLCYPSIISNIKSMGSNQELSQDDSGWWMSLKDTLFSTLTNPLFLLISFAVAIDSMLLAGLSAFLPKYIEVQFKLSAGFSAQIVGILVVPAGAAAVLLGGWIVKKLKLTRDRILIYCVVIQLLNIPLVFMFLLFCPTQNYVGLNYHPEQEHHQEQISEGGFAQVCNANCFCNHETADPVCGSDGLMYLSPCLAGCQNFGSNNFTGCSCITDSISSATRKTCDDGCNYLNYFLPTCFFSMFLTFLVSMPNTAVTLRSVKMEHRSMAIGLQSIIARLIGGIPGPIMFGYFIDRTCLYWRQTDDSSNGSCLVYDNTAFATFLTSVSVTIKTVASIFYLLSLFASKRSKILDVKL